MHILMQLFISMKLNSSPCISIIVTLEPAHVRVAVLGQNAKWTEYRVAVMYVYKGRLSVQV
jgi:hypothetical protein